MDPKRKDSEKPDSSLVLLGRYTGHGLTIALAAGLFLLAGWWVDGRIGTTPLFTVAGAVLGAGAGFYSMLQHLLFLPREKERRRHEEGSPRKAGEEEANLREGERRSGDGRT